jgi:hypothetical protein
VDSIGGLLLLLHDKAVCKLEAAAAIVSQFDG